MTIEPEDDKNTIRLQNNCIATLIERDDKIEDRLAIIEERLKING
jgi:hypothetical protein